MGGDTETIKYAQAGVKRPAPAAPSSEHSPLRRPADEQPPQARLCIVVPCHNEEQSLPLFMDAMQSQAEPLAPYLADLSYVFVDDGSSDGTLAVLKQLHEKNPSSHYVSFTRNFGKEAAFLAGLRTALGTGATHIAVMDADLQDPPSLLPEMLEKMRSTGAQVVAAYRTTREGEPRMRSWFAHRFYHFINRVSDVHMRDGARDFRIMRRPVVETIVAMPERCRFSKGLFMWGGFPTEWVGYENAEREGGKSSWSFWKLARYAIEGIVSFSVVPLEAISVTGLVVFLLALVFLVIIIVRAALFGDPVSGWPSLVCIITLFSGMLIFGMGVLGLYQSRIYQEIKQRPVYLVREKQ
ncbi:MAG: glycosyltransferase family 2 protein [Eggerthellaceae bacterium]|jgi:glucosyltransferase